jgi:hypothetical protein
MEEVSMHVVRPCEFRGVHAGVAVVVCPPGLSDAELRMIGRRTCFGHQDCTAWFWDEPASAPDGPPTPESPMSEAQADAAVAIYIAGLDRICRAMPDEQAA